MCSICGKPGFGIFTDDRGSRRVCGDHQEQLIQGAYRRRSNWSVALAPDAPYDYGQDLTGRPPRADGYHS